MTFWSLFKRSHRDGSLLKTPKIHTAPPADIYRTAPFYVKWGFSWVSPLITLAHQRPLQLEDIPDLTYGDDCDLAAKGIQYAWEKEKSLHGPKARLWRAIFHQYWLQYMFVVFLGLSEMACKVGGTLAIKHLLLYIQDTSATDAGQRGYLFAGALSLIVLVQVILRHFTFFSAWVIATRIRAGLTVYLYKHLHSVPIGSISPSGLVNLISVDVGKIEDGFAYYFFLVTAPCEAVIVTWLLYEEIGWPALCGMAFFLILVPLQTFCARYFGIVRQRILKIRDRIMTDVSDLLEHIDVVKVYAWDKPIHDRVIKERNKEMSLRKKSLLVASAETAVACVALDFILLISFMVMHLTGLPFDPSQVYTVSNLLSVCVMTFTVFLSRSLELASESRVSIERVQHFLETPVLQWHPTEKPAALPSIQSINGVSIHLENAAVSWAADPSLTVHTSEQQAHYKQKEYHHALSAKPKDKGRHHYVPMTPGSAPVIQGLTCDLLAGETTVVIGAVGGGKSSFLLSLLGELPLVEGTARMTPHVPHPGAIAYAPQQPFILSTTVRDNVTFGRPWDEERWRRAVHASRLESDLPQLPGGRGRDTFVGEGGKLLSGGQRARLGLARALYAPSELYLLDDVFSAVDVEVAREMFQSIVLGRKTGLIPPKATLIIATHQILFAPDADKLMIVERSKMVAFGRPADILLQEDPEAKAECIDVNQSFVSFARYRLKADVQRRNGKDENITVEQSPINPQQLPSYEDATLHPSHDKAGDSGSSSKDSIDNADNGDIPALGTIPFRVYRDYITSSFKSRKLKIFVITSVLFLLVAAEAALLYEQVQLNEWAKAKDGAARSAIFRQFVMAIVILITLQFARTVTFFLFSLRTSRGLFKRMFRSVLGAQMSWFDQTGPGGTLNRFTKDITASDESIPISAFDCIDAVLHIVGTFIIVGIKQPHALAAVPILLLIFVWIRNYYMAAGRQFKRLDAVSRSPIYSLVPTTFHGLPLIRSLNDTKRWIAAFQKRQTVEAKIFVTLCAGTRWLALRLDLLATAFLFFIAMVSIKIKVAQGGGADEAAKIGFIVTMVKGLIGLIQWAVRQSIEVETQMVSVERILELTHLEREETEEAKASSVAPPANWPAEGAIRVEHMNLTYPNAESPTLQDMDVTIQPNASTAIIGPSGSGKSSLTNAIFRLYTPEAKGAIKIDGQAIDAMRLEDVRKKICLLPQQAGVFCGTVRFNLDACGEYSEEAIWKVIDKVGLRHRLETHAPEDASGLDLVIEQDGRGWSRGELQLLCMARALLKGSKIFFLDEPTSAIDPRLDDMLQNNLRRIFEGATVVTVAHRLTTILDYDQILVIVNGRVHEMGTLKELMALEDGWLKSVVAEAGPEVNASVQSALQRHEK